MLKRQSPRSIVLLFALAVVGGAAVFALFTRASHAAAAAPVSKTIPPPAPTVAPAPQPYVHEVRPGQSLPAVAREYVAQTPFMTVAELESAVADANHLKPKARLQPGEKLIIPQYSAQPMQERLVSKPKTFPVRAIYLTGIMAGSEHGLRLIRQWHALGGNSVVFDVKDSDGILNVAFQNPLAPHIRHPYIASLPKLLHYIHSFNMHAIARMALFKDGYLATAHPELAVQSRRALAAADGKGVHPWLEHGKQVWVDPSNPKVQDYEIALAQAVIAAGADEVQFDYVRFPAESDQPDAQFAYMKTQPQWTRADVIADFLARAYQQLHPTGALLSLDVFGVMAWRRPADLNHTGQDIARMARSCDVLSPMIYPSHFFGMEGYAHPGDAPEHFISESMQRFEQVTQGSGVVIRPWLQAFAWRTKSYSPQYVETQVKVANENGGDGFLLWNAGNDYSRAFAAMPVMTAAPQVYFAAPATNAAKAVAANTAAASLTPGRQRGEPAFSR